MCLHCSVYYILWVWLWADDQHAFYHLFYRLVVWFFYWLWHCLYCKCKCNCGEPLCPKPPGIFAHFTLLYPAQDVRMHSSPSPLSMKSLWDEFASFASAQPVHRQQSAYDRIVWAQCHIFHLPRTTTEVVLKARLGPEIDKVGRGWTKNCLKAHLWKRGLYVLLKGTSVEKGLICTVEFCSGLKYIAWPGPSPLALCSNPNQP